MSFEDVGNILRAEREKKNYSVEDVADHLKINPRYIRALENGDFDSLPHLAYVKGFIRSYANFLEIPQDEIQAELGITESEGYKKPPETISSANAHGKILILCIVLILLIGGGWFLWNTGYFSSFLNSNSETSLIISEPEAENTAKADNSTVKEQAQELNADTSNANNSREIAKNSNPEESPAIPAETQGDQNTQQALDMQPSKNPQAENAAATDNAAVAGQTASDAPAPASGLLPQHQLIITATEECWVHSNADKTDTRQFSLRKGDTFALTFNVTLELKLGNAGGVKLRYDGKDLPAAGTSGQVKTINFPPDQG